MRKSVLKKSDEFEFSVAAELSNFSFEPPPFQTALENGPVRKFDSSESFRQTYGADSIKYDFSMFVNNVCKRKSYEKHPCFEKFI